MKKIVRTIFLLLCIGILTACQSEYADTEGTAIELYYLNKEETKVLREEYTVEAEMVEAQVEELIGALSEPPDNLANKAPISGNVRLLNYRIEESQLSLTFDEYYKELPFTTEVLTRAALVRSFTQLEGIEYVVMQVREETLTDALGVPVGVMSADTFIDNAGEEINAYEEVNLRLYFADESGTRLIEAIRPYMYNTNISLEKLVLEQLIAGPNNDELHPTINPDTKVVSATVRDGICYVNLDETFLTQIYNVTAEVTVYSIVNSLIELPNINKVQILINGETDISYRENIYFTTLFERNLDLVGTPPAQQ